jgi:hypothetical protein
MHLDEREVKNTTRKVAKYECWLHAIRGEHDWAIVMDSMCKPKGHTVCGTSPVKDDKLWAPFTRWNMLS